MHKLKQMIVDFIEAIVEARRARAQNFLSRMY